MADNVAITAGSGTNIATDDVAGTHYQRMKLVDGTLDSTTAIAAGGGVEAGALRVTVASDSTGVLSVDDNGGSLTVDGTVTANAGTGSFTVAQATAGNLNATVVGSGNFTVVQSTAASLNATVAQGTAANLLATVNNRDGSGNALTSALRGSERALSVQLVDASGNQVTSFGGGTQYTEDAASSGGETGTVILGVRNDSATSKTSADGDFSALATDSAGRVGIADLGGAISVDDNGSSLTVDGFASTGAAAFVKITDGTNTAVVNSGGGLEITGSTSHDAVDGGNPLKIGAVAESSIVGTANVADGDRTNVYADLDGVLITKQLCTFGDIIVTRVTDTGGTSTAFSAFGAVASQRNYITTITVYNSSTTQGFIDLRDGTGGSVIYTIPLPALGGATINFPVPLRQPTVNTALAYDVSAAITTAYISVVGFKGY